jgi:hypothetical protein
MVILITIYVLTLLLLQQFPFYTLRMSRYTRVALFLNLCYRTTSLLHVACDGTDRNRYSILSTSPKRSNISLPPHYSKFQPYGSELEKSLLCSYEL